jgi:acetylglutamate kinase
MGAVVIKIGGDVVEDAEERRGLVENVRALKAKGRDVVLLHGGGPQVSRLQARLGVEPVKVGGRRVTSPSDLILVEQAICGEVNVALTSALLAGGIEAFGCHGASGRMVRAVKRPPKVVAGGGDEPVDFGEVGDVERVDDRGLRALLGAGFVPVVATLGVTSEGGRVFNINADTTSVQIAKALAAEALIMVTKVGAVLRDVNDPATRIARVTPDGARALIEEGVIAGGMIPKVEEAISVLDEGVGAIVIVGAREDGAFVRALAGEVGTKIARGARTCCRRSPRSR